MDSVFIGGSRKISKLNGAVKERLDRIMTANLTVLVGDANGADKAVQTYLFESAYSAVEVFCAAGHCRNNVGNWPVRSIDVPKNLKGHEFYAVKDQAMTKAASFGLMLWDGESLGTLVNAFRLSEDGKKTVIYVSKFKDFVDIKNREQWSSFSDTLPLEIKKDLFKRVLRERPKQTALL